jgi:hypothetical protein
MMIEVRGELPEEIQVADGTTVRPDSKGGTVPKDAHFACGACGKVQRIVASVEATGKSGPVAPLAVQGFSPTLKASGAAYGGRFFLPVSSERAFAAAWAEWDERKNGDLAQFWPRSEIPYGHMTHERQPLPQHGYRRWSDFFNPRQMLVHAIFLKTILEVGPTTHRWEAREFVLAAFQQYLRNQNMLCFWHRSHDHFAPALSNNNFHPKDVAVEVGVFCPVGYGPWPSTSAALHDALKWSEAPWDLVSNDWIRQAVPAISSELSGKSEKVSPGDVVSSGARLSVGSATDLSSLSTSSFDLVVTDPPFGGLLFYAELSDFFYVWLRLALRNRYPDLFDAEYTPKTLEAIANPAQNPYDSDKHYQRILTESWREASRILKPTGLLTFTFHHSQDAPWVAVLESLFDAGFYLEATY